MFHGLINWISNEPIFFGIALGIMLEWWVGKGRVKLAELKGLYWAKKHYIALKDGMEGLDMPDDTRTYLYRRLEEIETLVERDYGSKAVSRLRGGRG